MLSVVFRQDASTKVDVDWERAIGLRDFCLVLGQIIKVTGTHTIKDCCSYLLKQVLVTKILSL